MDFNFLVPNELIVKRGAADEIGKVCARYMKRAAVFRYGEHFLASGLADRVERSLRREGLEVFLFHALPAEPDHAAMNEAAAFMAENGCDGALAIGGGSVIDTAKAACALAPNGTNIMEYVEGFSPKRFAHRPLPLVAMPTTAGTGSECTKNSVVTSKGRFKNSVRDDAMLPAAAVLDAELMVSVPLAASMRAGADCICQLIESYVTRFSNPLADPLLPHFTAVAYGALKDVRDNPQNVDAREKMGLCAAVGGIGICNAGLGAAHGLAAGLGALTPLSHGLICGVLTPHIIRFNVKKGVKKYADVARAISKKSYANDEEAAYAAADLMDELNRFIGIPADFRQAGIQKSEIAAIAKASMGSSMQKNPAEVSQEECEEILNSLV